MPPVSDLPISRRRLLATAPVVAPLIVTQASADQASGPGTKAFDSYLTSSQRADLMSGLGQIDMTDALQRAIDASGGQKPVEVMLEPSNVLRVLGTVYIPPNVTIDLGSAVIKGAGNNTLFETGMRNGGKTSSNFDAPNETQIVFKSSVSNGSLTEAGLGFRLQNFCEGSALTNIRMSGLRQGLYARRCFFASFRRLVARAHGRGGAAIAFRFDDAVNAIDLNGLVSEGYRTAFWFDGQKGGTLVQNCSAENGIDGMVFLGPTAAVTLSGNYFENLSGVALRFDRGAAHDSVSVSGNWFYGVKVAVNGATVRTGTWHRDNALNGAAIKLGTDLPPGPVVEIPDAVSAANGPVELPANYDLGAAVLVDHVQSIAGTTGVAIRGRVHNGPAPHIYSGGSGTPAPGTVPFCTYLMSAATPAMLTIHTGISHSSFEMIGYSFEIETAKGVIGLAGVIIGLKSTATVSSGKSITVTEQKGRMCLVLGPFEGDELPCVPTGIVRQL